MRKRPRVLWHEFLEGKIKLEGEAERRMRFVVRRRAQRYMRDLIFILKNLEKVSKRPDREFARIFGDEEQFVSLIETLHWAYDKSFQSSVKLANEDNFRALQIGLVAAGIRYKSNRALYDKGYRLDLVRRLKRKEKADGKPYFRQIYDVLLRNKASEPILLQRREERRKRVNCPKCGLEQAPVENYVMCPHCRFQGAVIGNLYQGP
jgi:hypothetical protein